MITKLSCCESAGEASEEVWVASLGVAVAGHRLHVGGCFLQGVLLPESLDLFFGAVVLVEDVWRASVLSEAADAELEEPPRDRCQENGTEEHGVEEVNGSCHVEGSGRCGHHGRREGVVHVRRSRVGLLMVPHVVDDDLVAHHDGAAHQGVPCQGVLSQSIEKYGKVNL